MNEKMIDKISFWMGLISAEIVLYFVVFVGVSIVSNRVFDEFNLLPTAVLSAILSVFFIWRRFMRGSYAEDYKEHITKKKGVDEK